MLVCIGGVSLAGAVGARRVTDPSYATSALIAIHRGKDQEVSSKVSAGSAVRSREAAASRRAAPAKAAQTAAARKVAAPAKPAKPVADNAVVKPAAKAPTLAKPATPKVAPSKPDNKPVAVAPGATAPSKPPVVKPPAAQPQTTQPKPAEAPPAPAPVSPPAAATVPSPADAGRPCRIARRPGHQPRPRTSSRGPRGLSDARRGQGRADRDRGDRRAQARTDPHHLRGEPDDAPRAGYQGTQRRAPQACHAQTVRRGAGGAEGAGADQAHDVVSP